MDCHARTRILEVKRGIANPALPRLPNVSNRILSTRMGRFSSRSWLYALFVCLSLAMADSSAAQRVKVSLGVAGPDDTKNKIFSYLVANLAQRGVDLVGSGADYQIRIIALHLESKKRRGAGYAVSIVVTAPVSPEHPRHGFKHPLVDHLLEVSPPNGLEDLCKRVVEAIDHDVLEVHRHASADSE